MSTFSKEEMKRVLILDCPEIGCPKVLVRVFQEFCGVFRRRKIPVDVIHSLVEIQENDLVLMGDVFRTATPARLLAEHMRNAFYIGWYWHQQDTSMLPHFFHVYENVLSNTLLPEKLHVVQFMQQHSNSNPLLLRVDEDPIMIGTYPRECIYDFCFMGGRMCEWLVPSAPFKGVYWGVHDVDQYLSYEERRQIYLRSIFALGFQTSDNIVNGHVSQRIFEGMAYGCVVLSNSPYASLQTNGIVEYIAGDNKNAFEERMMFFLTNPHLIQKKQQDGYEFIKKYGTNEYAWQQIAIKFFPKDEHQTRIDAESVFSFSPPS